MSELSNWASRLLFPDRNKAEFDKFVQEVNDESVEHLSFQAPADASLDLRRTFEQLPQDVILDEVTKDIGYLKAMDAVLHDRAQGNKEYAQQVAKSRGAHEAFQHCNAGSSLQHLLTAFTAYTETDVAHARALQQQGELRRELGDMRVDAQRRLTDFQREVASAERDLFSSEKRLNKSKDQLDKYLRQEAVAAASAAAEGTGGSSAGLSSSPLFGAPSRSTSVAAPAVGSGTGAASSGSGSGTIFHPNAPAATSSMYSDGGGGGGGAEDYIVVKYERDIRDDVRGLLRAIAAKDQALSASRRAYQKLDRTAKAAVVSALRRSVQLEREAHDARGAALQELERALAAHSQEVDEDAFIDRFSSEAGCFVQSSQALTILGDLDVSRQQNAALCEGGARPRGRSRGGSALDGAAAPLPAPAPPAPVGLAAASPAPPAPATAGKSHGFSLFSSFKNDKKEESAPTAGTSGGSSGSCSPLSPSGLQPGNQIPSRDSMRTEPITYGQPTGAQAAAHHAAAAALTPAAAPAAAATEQLSGRVMDCLSRVFYMTNRAQLSPGYLDIILGQGAVAGRSRADSGVEADCTAPSRRGAPPPAAALHGVPLDVLLLCRDWKKDPSRASGVNTGGTGSLQVSYTVPLMDAVNEIIEIVETDAGRGAFVSCLNQFRSKQVNVGISFGWLGAVLWTVLDFCHGYNDIHSAKIIMMLAQTFYYRNCDVYEGSSGKCSESPKRAKKSGATDGEEEEGEEEEEEDDSQRKTADRIYLTSLLTTHSLWRDPKFWEQALWTCVIEQLSAMPHEKVWYDMGKEEREAAVRRVHDVTFSQVMGVTHSMISLKCSPTQSREFVFRMCAVHQLSEAQRLALLQHLMGAS